MGLHIIKTVGNKDDYLIKKYMRYKTSLTNSDVTTTTTLLRSTYFGEIAKERIPFRVFSGQPSA